MHGFRGVLPGLRRRVYEAGEQTQNRNGESWGTGSNDHRPEFINKERSVVN